MIIHVKIKEYTFYLTFDPVSKVVTSSNFQIAGRNRKPDMTKEEYKKGRELQETLFNNDYYNELFSYIINSDITNFSIEQE